MNLTDRIEKNETCYGMFLALKDPAIVEIIGYAGYDFGIIDLEHSSLDLSVMEHMIRASETINLNSVVRVPQNDYGTILRAAEAGADTVMIPHLMDGKQAKDIVDMAKYYPIGKRGLDASTRIAQYGNKTMAEHMKIQNKRIQIIGMIEDQEAVENIDEILAVQGIDLLFIGAADLSSSFGLPGEVSHPKLREAIQSVIDKSNEVNVPVGMPAYDAEQANELREMGVKFIATPAVDTFLISEMFNNHLQNIKKFKKTTNNSKGK